MEHLRIDVDALPFVQVDGLLVEEHGNGSTDHISQLKFVVPVPVDETQHIFLQIVFVNGQWEIERPDPGSFHPLAVDGYIENLHLLLLLFKKINIATYYA